MLIDELSTPQSEPSVAVLTPKEAPHAYCWPVWRFGRVLDTLGGERLSVETAQEIGNLFEAGGRSLRRYLKERLQLFRRLAARCAGELSSSRPPEIEGSEAIRHLRTHWRESDSLITYSFVPIVRLPSLLLKLEETLWHVRESLTICGEPAKSKVWFAASLIAFRGCPTDQFPLTRLDLDSARNQLDPIAGEALNDVADYYLRALNEDTAHLRLQQPVHFERFELRAHTEIVSVAASQDLDAGFDILDEQGLTRLREKASQNQFAGAREVRDFLEWTEQLGRGPEGKTWMAGRPKLLAIYAENPSCGSVRALVVPRLIPEANRTWYTLLTEALQRPEWKVPLSESASRFTAREYGRYF
jgi:hypothetical protein